MLRKTRRSFMIFLRIAAMTAVFVGPVGAWAMANAGVRGDSLSGAGFVLYVSLQRNAG